MEDRNQLDRIFSYIDEQKNMGKTVAEEDIEEKNYKAQELWKEKVWRGYAELKKAGFKGGDSLFLIAAYFAGKQDKTITSLLRRLQMVMKEREDLISGGMLAASYYGIFSLSLSTILPYVLLKELILLPVPYLQAYCFHSSSLLPLVYNLLL